MLTPSRVKNRGHREIILETTEGEGGDELRQLLVEVEVQAEVDRDKIREGHTTLHIR